MHEVRATGTAPTEKKETGSFQKKGTVGAK